MLLFNKVILIDVLMISLIFGFMIILFFGWLFDKIGCWILYIIMNIFVIVLVWLMFFIIVDKSYVLSIIMVVLIVIYNCVVLGLFVLENIIMVEMFGCKNCFIWMVIFKEIGGFIVFGFGFILVGIFCIMMEFWYLIVIMIMVYLVIGLIFVLKMLEVKDCDLSVLEDAVED